MRSWMIISVVVVCVTVARGTTIIKPTPEFEEVATSAAFIGIVEVISVPKSPAGGFWGDKPPAVGLRVIESWKGAPKGTTVNYLWDEALRPEVLIDVDESAEPFLDASKVPIALPPKGERLVIFAEMYKGKMWRDIWGWPRARIVQSLSKPERNPSYPEKYPEWGPGLNRCLRAIPLQEIPRAQSHYNRRAYLYTTTPNDVWTRGCVSAVNVTEPGEYWLLMQGTAEKMTVTTIEPNPEFPVKYTVRKGDSLVDVATRFYGDDTMWKAIADANRIPDPSKIEPGNVLVIPPLPDRAPAGHAR